MSERPFMQLYVSDYLGDTRHLSCEQHGAYLLLLMTMWNAGGSLPNDDAKLARIVCCTVKKWRSIRDDVLAFFDVSEAVISHNRLTKELSKSESKSQLRASAGAKGGTAKALKDNEVHIANASRLPQHLPDTITRDTSSLRSDVERAKRATRLSENWKLPADWRQEAIDAGFPANLIDAEEVSIRDWSLSSTNGVKRDWHATWRTWYRRRLTELGQPRGSPTQKPRAPSQSDVFKLIGERAAASGQDSGDRSGVRPAILDLRPARTG